MATLVYSIVPPLWGNLVKVIRYRPLTCTGSR